MEKSDRILVFAVVRDFLLRAVSVVRVGHGMPTIAVGENFQQRRFGFLVRALDRLGRFFAHLVEDVAVAQFPRHVVALGALGQRLARARTLLARAHRVFVVLDDEHHRQIPQRRQIIRLVHRPLVHRAVAHERQATALDPLVFQRIGQPRPQRHLPADNPVPAPVFFVRREKVHRAALALRTTRDLPRQLRHALIH